MAQLVFALWGGNASFKIISLRLLHTSVWRPVGNGSSMLITSFSGTMSENGQHFRVETSIVGV